VTDSEENTARASVYSLTQMTYWLDASTITGLALGAPVAQWNDISGNANHATQGNPAWRPLFYDDGGNGQDCLAIGNTTSISVPEVMSGVGITTLSVGHFTSGYMLADDTNTQRSFSISIANVGGIDKYLLYLVDAVGAVISASAGDTSGLAVIAANARNQGANLIFNGTTTVGSEPTYVPGAWNTSGILTGPSIGVGAGVSLFCEQISYASLLVANDMINAQCYLSSKYNVATALSCP